MHKLNMTIERLMSWISFSFVITIARDSAIGFSCYMRISNMKLQRRFIGVAFSSVITTAKSRTVENLTRVDHLNVTFPVVNIFNLIFVVVVSARNVVRRI